MLIRETVSHPEQFIAKQKAHVGEAIDKPMQSDSDKSQNAAALETHPYLRWLRVSPVRDPPRM
jgi:hypothetical protein